MLSVEQNKSVSSIVVTSLLVLISILAVVSLQSFYSDYFTNLLEKIDLTSTDISKDKSLISIDTLIGKYLYINAQNVVSQNFFVISTILIL